MFLVLAIICGLASVEDSGFVSFAPYILFLFEHLRDPPLPFYLLLSFQCNFRKEWRLMHGMYQPYLTRNPQLAWVMRD